MTQKPTRTLSRPGTAIGFCSNSLKANSVNLNCGSGSGYNHARKREREGEKEIQRIA